MKAIAGLLALAVLAAPAVSEAQSRNCIRIENQILCDNGDSATDIGTARFFFNGE